MELNPETSQVFRSMSISRRKPRNITMFVCINTAEYSLMMYIMIPTSIGPGMDPLSFLVISSNIDLVHSVSIHSSAKNSALCDASASNATINRNQTISFIITIHLFYVQVQRKHTQEKCIRRRMTNEFYERFLHELTHFRIRIQHVHRTVHWEHGTKFADFDHLSYHTFPTKTRQTVVPDGGQQLLNVWMCNKLYLKKNKRQTRPK